MSARETGFFSTAGGPLAAHTDFTGVVYGARGQIACSGLGGSVAASHILSGLLGASDQVQLTGGLFASANVAGSLLTTSLNGPQGVTQAGRTPDWGKGSGFFPTGALPVGSSDIPIGWTTVLGAAGPLAVTGRLGSVLGFALSEGSAGSHVFVGRLGVTVAAANAIGPRGSVVVNGQVGGVSAGAHVVGTLGLQQLAPRGGVTVASNYLPGSTVVLQVVGLQGKAFSLNLISGIGPARFLNMSGQGLVQANATVGGQTGLLTMTPTAGQRLVFNRRRRSQIIRALAA